MEARIRQLKRIASLPANVRTNVAALRKIHLDMAEYERHRSDLELDFSRLYAESVERRRQIVVGTYQPRAEDLPVGYSGAVSHSACEQPGGVPGFWLAVFRMSELMGEMVAKVDEEVLGRLVDVRVVDRAEPEGFELWFEFGVNEFFADSVLKKSYLTKGGEIYEAIGQEIRWKGGADLTKKCGDSFFNFFSPKRYEESDPERHEYLLKKDFEVGRYLEECVIPRATAIFLGREDDGLDELADMLEDEAFCGVYSLDEEAEKLLVASDLEGNVE